MNQGSQTPHGNWDEQRETISTYVDDALAQDERAAFERHLTTCASCQRELEELRQVRALLRRLPSPALPRSFTLPAEPAAAPARPASPASPPVPSPTPTRTPAPARTVIPWPQRAGKIAQRIGTLAAAVGIVLLLASAVQGHGGLAGGTSTASSNIPAASNAGGAADNRQTTATARASGGQFGVRQQTPGQIPQTQVTQAAPGAEGTPTPTATATAEPASQAPQASGREPRTSTALGEAPPNENPPLLPLTGAGLLIGGAAVALGGRVAARRGRSHGRGR
jgi:anti-sigma factor RsiW